MRPCKDGWIPSGIILKKHWQDGPAGWWRERTWRGKNHVQSSRWTNKTRLKGSFRENGENSFVFVEKRNIKWPSTSSSYVRQPMQHGRKTLRPVEALTEGWSRVVIAPLVSTALLQTFQNAAKFERGVLFWSAWVSCGYVVGSDWLHPLYLRLSGWIELELFGGRRWEERYRESGDEWKAERRRSITIRFRPDARSGDKTPVSRRRHRRCLVVQTDWRFHLRSLFEGEMRDHVDNRWKFECVCPFQSLAAAPPAHPPARPSQWPTRFYLVLIHSLIMASLSWRCFSAAPWRTELAGWQWMCMCAALWWSRCRRFHKGRLGLGFTKIVTHVFKVFLSELYRI